MTNSLTFDAMIGEEFEQDTVVDTVVDESVVDIDLRCDSDLDWALETSIEDFDAPCSFDEDELQSWVSSGSSLSSNVDEDMKHQLEEALYDYRNIDGGQPPEEFNVDEFMMDDCYADDRECYDEYYDHVWDASEDVFEEKIEIDVGNDVGGVSSFSAVEEGWSSDVEEDLHTCAALQVMEASCTYSRKRKADNAASDDFWNAVFADIPSQDVTTSSSDSGDFVHITEAAERRVKSRKEVHVIKAFLCPISRDIMTDPVMCADGFTYEHEYIAALINQANIRNEAMTSPMNHEIILSDTRLIPNYALKAAIEEFQEVKGW
jgi:hypothetical protein